MKISRETMIELEGRGTLRLQPNQHIATGGEASLYRAGKTVIKLYTDPRRFQQAGMVDNLRRLSQLSHEYVVAPLGLVYNMRGEAIGYHMHYVEGEPLPSVFTTAFRQRTGFGDSEASRLVDGMFKVMHFAHDHDEIMVDPNELNWLGIPVRQPELAPRALDVDAWITGSYRPATIPMMPSIRDWHANNVGHSTDRFALAVVTFQVYTGIHPYKGTLEPYRRADLTGRMQNNASVFTPGVRLNHVVRDFSCIPSQLREWYEAVFQSGVRTAPPSPFAAPIHVAPSVKVGRIAVTTTGTVKYWKLLEIPNDPVVKVFSCGIVRTHSGALYHLETSRRLVDTTSPDCEVVKVDRGWLIAEDGGQLSFRFVNEMSYEITELPLDFTARALVRYYDRLFVVTDRGLTELKLKHFARPMIMLGNTWETMVNSTRWFDGGGVLDAMGAMFLFVPFGTDSCTQVRVRELDDLRVISLKSGRRFVSIIALDKQGMYQKLELTFDRTYTTYTVWKDEAESPEHNMALLPKGVNATIVQDGTLTIFVPSSGEVKRVKDKDITTELTLAQWNDTVVAIRDGQVWRVSLG